MRTLLILSHPSLSTSVANKTIVEEINYPAAEQRGMQYHFKITAIDNLCVLPYNQGCPDS
jgi:hypothetical protein